jgi:hypothetical protein
METTRELEEQFLIGGDVFAESNRQIANDSGFLGSLYSDTRVVQAGSWRQIRLTYVVGIAGLAKGGSFKIVFRSDSDWADFQTWDPSGENYLSAELVLRDSVSGDQPAQILAVRYDSTGDRKSILVTVVEGGLLLVTSFTCFWVTGVTVDGEPGADVCRGALSLENSGRLHGVSGYSELDPAPELVITAGPLGNLRLSRRRPLQPVRLCRSLEWRIGGGMSARALPSGLPSKFAIRTERLSYHLSSGAVSLGRFTGRVASHDPGRIPLACSLRGLRDRLRHFGTGHRGAGDCAEPIPFRNPF